MNAQATASVIEKVNNVLSEKKSCTINIVNDKLTLSVFALLRENLRNVNQIPSARGRN